MQTLRDKWIELLIGALLTALIGGIGYHIQQLERKIDLKLDQVQKQVNNLNCATSYLASTQSYEEIELRFVDIWIDEIRPGHSILKTLENLFETYDPLLKSCDDRNRKYLDQIESMWEGLQYYTTKEFSEALTEFKNLDRGISCSPPILSQPTAAACL